MKFYFFIPAILVVTACGNNENKKEHHEYKKIDGKTLLSDAKSKGKASDPERYAPGEWRKVSLQGKDFMVSRGFRGMTRIAYRMNDEQIVATGDANCKGGGPVVVKATSGDARSSHPLRVDGAVRMVAEIGLAASCISGSGKAFRGSAAAALDRL